MLSPEASKENFDRLKAPYPGRVVIAGLDQKGEHYYLISATGGRSEGSLNRIYVRDGDEVRTAVYDFGKLVGDPGSTLYVAHAHAGGVHVASNGAQTVGIAASVRRDGYLGVSGEQQLWEHGRITAVVDAETDELYMGKISVSPFSLTESNRTVYQLDHRPGFGYIMMTYDGKGGTDPFTEDPLPYFIAGGTIQQEVSRIWGVMNPDTRCSIVGKAIEIETGNFHYSRIINRNKGAGPRPLPVD